jgi:hypothetical protein
VGEWSIGRAGLAIGESARWWSAREAVARAFQTRDQSGRGVSAESANRNTFVDSLGAFGAGERSSWAAFARSRLFLVLVESARAQGAALGATESRGASRAMEAAGNVGSGRHVEDLADAAGKSSAQ